MNDFLPIETERLRLRRLHAADVARFAHYRADPELARFQGWSPMSADQAAEFVGAMQVQPAFVEDSWLQVAIALAASDELLGDLGICLHRGGDLEVGFTLRREAQGQGFATEALGGLFRAALARAEVRRIVGHVDARNLASIRVMERLGMALVASSEADFKGERCTELRYERVNPSARP